MAEDSKPIAPCPFCNRPDAVPLQQQELYEKDARGIAVLTPAGFAALDRHLVMTDRIEELNIEVERLKSEWGKAIVANTEVALINAEQAETIERLRAALEWYSTAGIGTFDGGKRAHEALRGADETAVQTSAIACAHPVSNYRCPTCGIEVQSENSDAPR